MVRGRKKNLTVPPTRQLTLQRDYRARKAQYLSELEERCSRAEEENARLRRELELARAAIPFVSPREVVRCTFLLNWKVTNTGICLGTGVI